LPDVVRGRTPDSSPTGGQATAGADTRFRRSFSRLAAALLLVGVGSAAVVRVLGSHGGAVAELAAVAPPRRAVVARISGFSYAPLATDRGARSARPNWRLLAAAARAEDRSVRDPTAENVHAAGLAHLLLGGLKEAVRELRRAHSLSGDPVLAGDLGAALIQLALRDDRPADAAEALDLLIAGEGARPTADTLFNEALALETIGMSSQAAAAWQRYSQADSTSGWANEAQERLSRLQERLLLVREQSCEETEKEVLERLLPQWAEAALARRDIDERMCLRTLTLLTHEHVARHHDPFLAELAATAEGATGNGRSHLARGHLEYAEARRRYAGDELTACIETGERAARDLAEGGSAASSLALLAVASCQFSRQDFAAAKRALDSLVRERPTALDASPILRGQVDWLRALLAQERSQPDAALALFDEAIGAFASAGDTQREGAVLGLLADLDEYLGRRDQAWADLGKGLRLGQLTALRRFEMLASVVDLAARQGEPYVALRAAEAAQGRARAAGQPALAVDADILLGRARERLHDRTGSAAAYRQALIAASSIGDPAARRRAAAHAAGALANLLVETDPQAAERLLTTADASSVGDLYLGIALARAELRRRAGDLAGAAAVLRGADNRSRSEEATLSSRRERDELLNHRAALRQELVRVLVAGGRVAEALGAVDAWRAGTPRSGVADRAASGGGSATDEGPAAAYCFLALPERLLIWRIDKNGTRLAERPISRDDLARDSATVREQVTDKGARQLGRLLFEALPPLPRERLILAPDDILFDVPFAALLLPGNVAPLVAEHEVTVVPWLGSWTRRLAQRPRRPCVLLLEGAASGGDLYPQLPVLGRQGEELAAVARSYRCSSSARSPAELEAGRASLPGVVHFAGHSVVGGDGAGFLLLRSGERVMPVAAAALARWPVAGAVVVLSSCASAGGRASPTAGRDGLARAALDAGALAVVADAWPVDDDAALEFSSLLHTHLGSGETVASAVRAAQRTMMARHRQSAAWVGWRVIAGG